MDIENAALLAESTYIMGGKGKSRQQKYNDINKMVEKTGYTVIPKHTNKNMVTFQDKQGNVHLSQQGTNVKSTTGFKDIANDIAIGLGFGGHLDHTRKRKRKAEKVVRELNPENLTMSSHSLGGYTQNYTIANSKKVRNKLKKAYTFNGAANPILDNDLNVKPSVKKELEDKVVHARVQGDLVSAGFKKKLPFGKLETYKLKDEHKDERAGQRILNKLTSFNPLLSTVSNLGKKAIDAHHVSHWHEKKLDKVDKNSVQAVEEEKEQSN